MASQKNTLEGKSSDYSQEVPSKNFSKSRVFIINMIVIFILIGAWYFSNDISQFFKKEQNQAIQSELYQKSFLFFGTLVDVQIYSQSSSKANQSFNQLEGLYEQIHHNWHAWEQGGLLDKINHAIKNNQSIEVEKTVADLINQAIEISRLSDGFFNPAIGSLVNLWGFHGSGWQDNPVIPNQESIDAILKANPQMTDLEISLTNNPNIQSIVSNNSSLQLDMGAIAKGYAIDLAIDLLKEQGVESALVNAGGDLKVLGNKLTNQKGSQWQVGIKDPFNETALGSVALGGDKDAILFECQAGCAVATSGSSERFFIKNGVRYSHIINPKTGYPASDFAQVSVVHPSAIFADAAATALFVAGEEKFAAIAEKLGLKAYLIVNQKGDIVISPSMNQIFQAIE